MRPESSEYVLKTTGFFTNSCKIKIALESYFEERAQEVREKNWMNPDMHTTLVLRENLKMMTRCIQLGSL